VTRDSVLLPAHYIPEKYGQVYIYIPTTSISYMDTDIPLYSIPAPDKILFSFLCM
jgi:hypothetical protein